MSRIPLVIATRNKGKTEEIRALLADFPVDIKNLADFGPTPTTDEDGETFEDNAVKKARFTAKILGLPALADDSGLMVEALGGAPGVRSARYAGENASDEENNAKLLQELESAENRNAAFACVIAIAVPWDPALVYEGRLGSSSRIRRALRRDYYERRGWQPGVRLRSGLLLSTIGKDLRATQHRGEESGES
jgi:XTP/dITP diphosphohydrolase